MNPIDSKIVRDHVLYVLRGGGAHADFESLISDFPVSKINVRVDGVPYTAWQLLEHMRIAQWDILAFSSDPLHVSPEFPSGYWPARETEADEQDWRKSATAFRNDFEAMQILVENESSDLTALIPHGEGQTLLREALLVADHNAYHLGALAILKRILTSR